MAVLRLASLTKSVVVFMVGRFLHIEWRTVNRLKADGAPLHAWIPVRYNLRGERLVGLGHIRTESATLL